MKMIMMIWEETCKSVMHFYKAIYFCIPFVYYIANEKGGEDLITIPRHLLSVCTLCWCPTFVLNVSCASDWDCRRLDAKKKLQC